MKYLISAAGALLYLLLLVVVYYGYISLFRVDVVFYSSLYAALIALALYAVIVYFSPLFKRLNGLERFNAIIIAGLLGYIAAISVPTIIDRSLSFYILEKLEQRGGAIQRSKFNYIFTDEYMREHKLVDVRLTEQEASGTITLDEECVRLTEKGQRLAEFSRFFRHHFLPKKRLLLGEYTDELINPFARSDAQPDYLCE